jgi:hypothetical protein
MKPIRITAGEGTIPPPSPAYPWGKSMPRASGRLALIALLVGLSGCGGDDVNKPPSNAGTTDYAQESKDRMASMYGAPKAEKAQSNNAADMMRNMYNK